MPHWVPYWVPYLAPYFPSAISLRHAVPDTAPSARCAAPASGACPRFDSFSRHQMTGSRDPAPPGVAVFPPAPSRARWFQRLSRRRQALILGVHYNSEYFIRRGDLGALPDVTPGAAVFARFAAFTPVDGMFE